MKTIKFRAKNIHGEWCYGDLAHVRINNATKSPSIRMYILTHAANGGMLYITARNHVNENTIEQLVGIDEKGNEIYEKI